tara:strand:- start:27584 stop:27937 length:354 start_codon:yes stop_codon:yes gene_type:complete
MPTTLHFTNMMIPFTVPITSADPLLLLQEHSQDIKSLGVDKLGIFGSFARGEATEESDIDVYVEFQPGKKTYDNLCSLYFFLKELFGRSIDLVTDESLTERKARIILPTVRYARLNS